MKKILKLFKKFSDDTGKIVEKIKEIQLGLEQIDNLYREKLATRWEIEDSGGDAAQVDAVDVDLAKLRTRREALQQRLVSLKDELRENIRRDRQNQIVNLRSDVEKLETERNSLVSEAVSCLAKGLFIVNHLLGPDERPILWTHFPQREFTKVANTRLAESPLTEIFAESTAKAKKEFEAVTTWKNRRGELLRSEVLASNAPLLNSDIESTIKKMIGG